MLLVAATARRLNATTRSVRQFAYVLFKALYTSLRVSVRASDCSSVYIYVSPNYFIFLMSIFRLSNEIPIEFPLKVSFSHDNTHARILKIEPLRFLRLVAETKSTQFAQAMRVLE